MTENPLFSVVIPTTRPHYLKYSLASVLRQTFPDFEAVIAFNPVAGMPPLEDLPADERIRFVRSDKTLPMHENWERGFVATRGRWVTLLGDDDCLIPQALAVLAAAIERTRGIEALIWRWGGYVDPNWPGDDRGRARLPSYTASIWSRPSAEVERLLYGFGVDSMAEMKTWLPSIMRGAVRRTVMEQAIATSGKFCHGLTPDYGAAAQIAMLTKALHLLDLPLTILNHTRDSMTASSAGNTTIKERQFYDLVGNSRFEHAPVQSRLETNRAVICETIMSVRKKYKPEADPSTAAFLVWYCAGLLEAKAGGTDTAKAEAELEAVIGAMPANDRASIRSQIAALRSRPRPARVRHQWKISTIRALQQLAIAHPSIRRLARLAAPRFGIDIDAPGAGFRNIIEFSEFAGSIVGGYRIGRT